MEKWRMNDRYRISLEAESNMHIIRRRGRGAFAIRRPKDFDGSTAEHDPRAPCRVGIPVKFVDEVPVPFTNHNRFRRIVAGEKLAKAADTATNTHLGFALELRQRVFRVQLPQNGIVIHDGEPTHVIVSRNALHVLQNGHRLLAMTMNNILDS